MHKNITVYSHSLTVNVFASYLYASQILFRSRRQTLSHFWIVAIHKIRIYYCCFTFYFTHEWSLRVKWMNEYKNDKYATVAKSALNVLYNDVDKKSLLRWDGNRSKICLIHFMHTLCFRNFLWWLNGSLCQAAFTIYNTEITRFACLM